MFSKYRYILQFEKISGTFTGSSAVAWAQAIPRDGEVLTIDVTPLYFDSVTRELLEKRADVGRKIRRHIGPALQKLGI